MTVKRHAMASGYSDAETQHQARWFYAITRILLAASGILVGTSALIGQSWVAGLCVGGLFYGELRELGVNRWPEFTLVSDLASLLVIVVVTALATRFVADELTQSQAAARHKEQQLPTGSPKVLACGVPRLQSADPSA